MKELSRRLTVDEDIAKVRHHAFLKYSVYERFYGDWIYNMYRPIRLELIS